MLTLNRDQIFILLCFILPGICFGNPSLGLPNVAMPPEEVIELGRKLFFDRRLSINNTLSRTIMTSITTLLALLSIFIFGGAILKGFSFAMILGVIVGTYSSIYIANPILVRLNVSQKTILKEEKE